MTERNKTPFEAAGEEKPSNLLGELYCFLIQNKKYWMIPIVLILLVIGALVILGGTAAAPFIYTLF